MEKREVLFYINENIPCKNICDEDNPNNIETIFV